MTEEYTFGKDKVIFATKEDHEKPSNVVLPETEQAPGLILANGDINWNCPCLGGMATGPCGVEFRDAFSCFHYSESEPKGSDCYDAFRTMQDCFALYPTVYNNKDGDEPDLEDITNEAQNLVDSADLEEEGAAASEKHPQTDSKTEEKTTAEAKM